jgi:hypothetical protein
MHYAALVQDETIGERTADVDRDAGHDARISTSEF